MLFFTFCVAVEKKPRGVRSEGNARCGEGKKRLGRG